MAVIHVVIDLDGFDIGKKQELSDVRDANLGAYMEMTKIGHGFMVK